MSGCSSRRSTATLSPWTTLKTPSGRPASFHRAASHSAADGSFSLGFKTTVSPAAMATGKNHMGTIAGKLKGLITATGPSGWRTECTSTPVEAFSVNPPLSRCGMPQANSTTSWPRVTSPRASSRTLPCSAVMIAASSPLRALSSSRKANSTWLRTVREVSRHAGKAALAAATAASTSSTPARATSPVTWPVAGSVTDAVRPLLPSRRAPSIQCGMCSVMGVSVSPPEARTQSTFCQSRRPLVDSPSAPPVPLSLATVLDVPILWALSDSPACRNGRLRRRRSTGWSSGTTPDARGTPRRVRLVTPPHEVHLDVTVQPVHPRGRPIGLGDDPAVRHDPARRHLPPDSVQWGGRRQDDEAGRPTLGDAVRVPEVEHARGPLGDHCERLRDLVLTGELSGHHAGVRQQQRARRPEREPRVHDVVGPEGHVHPGRQHLLDPGQAPALRIGVEAALQAQVDDGVADQIDARARQQPLQLVGVGPAVAAHGGGVAGRHPLPQLPAQGQGRQHLDEAGLLVVDLVAVGVDQPAVPLGEVDGDLQGPDAVLARVLEVRDGADDVHPRRTASASSSSPPGKETIPSCGNATICRPTTSRTRSRSSRSASSASRRGSVTSQCVRTCRTPCAACHRSTCSARSRTSSRVTEGLRSDQTAMPSQRVPELFQRGSPAVSVASRWMCGSTNGGLT